MQRKHLTFLPVIILTVGLVPTFGSDNPPDTPRQMAENFNRAYDAGNTAEAIRWGLELETLQPGLAVNQYNLARVYALAGDERSAIDWLRRSTANGFRRTTTIENDPDLVSLHQAPQWTTILAAVQNNSENYQMDVRRAFSKDPPKIILPSHYKSETPVPLIIALHGYGGRPGGYPAFWQHAAGKIGAVLVAPHGLQPLENGFFWGNLEEAETLVLLAIEHSKKSCLIDENRIVLTGFSQGGFMAMAIGVKHPEIFAGVIPMAVAYNPAADTPAPAPPGAARFFFMVGSQDRAKPRCRKAAKDFEAAGYAVNLRVYPGVGHAFPRLTDRELGKALRFVLADR